MIWLVIFVGSNVKHHTLEPPLKVSSATGWLQKSRCAMGFTQSPPSGNSFQVSGALGSHCSVGLWKSIASMAPRRMGKQVRNWLQSVISQEVWILAPRLTFTPGWRLKKIHWQFQTLHLCEQSNLPKWFSLRRKNTTDVWVWNGDPWQVNLTRLKAARRNRKHRFIDHLQFPPSPKRKT